MSKFKYTDFEWEEPRVGLPPGPAYIPKRHWHDPVTREEAEAIRAGLMQWQPATDWTGAGWVRSRGRVDIPPQRPHIMRTDDVQ